MPETRAAARSRARKLGFPMGNVVRASGTKKYFIAPHGVKKAKAKRAYADCRAEGGKQSTCAAVSHNIDKGKKMRHR